MENAALYLSRTRQERGLVSIDEELDTILNNSTKIIGDLMKSEDVKIQIKGIETALKIRKQLVDERQFEQRMRLLNKDNDDTIIDWSNAELEENE